MAVFTAATAEFRLNNLMNLKHNFLLAMPDLASDYFAQSLTYICEHNEDGAIGIMINRPTDMSLIELFAQLGMPGNRAYTSTLLYEGGPVGPERGFVLHSADVELEAATKVAADVCLSTDLEALAAIAEDRGPGKFLVAMGYAGWGAGQLESEIANNAWLTAPASAEILFDTEPEQRLDAAAGSIGVDLRLIARPGHA